MIRSTVSRNKRLTLDGLRPTVLNEDPAATKKILPNGHDLPVELFELLEH